MKIVMFDLDGTLLPMDQDTFVNGYFTFLAKKMAPHGYEPQKLVKAIWGGTAAMVKNDGTCLNEEAFWRYFTGVYGEGARADIPLFEEFYANEFQQAQRFCGFDERAMSLMVELSETDPEAAGLIGLLYMQGAGVEQNDELAEKWLSKAVKDGQTDLEDSLERVRSQTGPMPEYECKLTNTKKGDRKERSELVRVGDKVTLALSPDGSRIDFRTAAGDVGDVSADCWLKDLLSERIPYSAEIVTSVPYSKLESKRMNPVIEVRLHIDDTKPEMKKRLGWDYIPDGIYGNGKYF